MRKVYHAAQQLPLDFSAQNTPDQQPIKHVSAKPEPRPCKSCGMDMKPAWEKTASGGGRWRYRCFRCKIKRKLEQDPDYHKKHYARRSPRTHEYNERRYAREKQRGYRRGVSHHTTHEHQQYMNLVAQQGNVCAICGKPETRTMPSGKITRLAIDHDHATGQIRALLCIHCNVALGCAGDDPERLRAMADYLEFHRSKAES